MSNKCKVYLKVPKDVSKRVLLPPLILLDTLSLCPKSRKNAVEKFSFCFGMFLTLTLEISQIIYVALYITDIKLVASTMYTVSTTLQVLKII